MFTPNGMPLGDLLESGLGPLAHQPSKRTGSLTAPAQLHAESSSCALINPSWDSPPQRGRILEVGCGRRRGRSRSLARILEPVVLIGSHRCRAAHRGGRGGRGNAK